MSGAQMGRLNWRRSHGPQKAESPADIQLASNQGHQPPSQHGAWSTTYCRVSGEKKIAGISQ